MLPQPHHVLECSWLVYYQEHLIGVTMLYKISPGHKDYPYFGSYLRVAEQSSCNQLFWPQLAFEVLLFCQGYRPTKCFFKPKLSVRGF